MLYAAHESKAVGRLMTAGIDSGVAMRCIFESDSTFCLRDGVVGRKDAKGFFDSRK